MQIKEKDLDIIAAMHISPTIHSTNLRTPHSQFRFFRDKVQLFYDFDPNSIILTKNDQNQITGILIYTYDEKKFNQFAGPRHLTFYVRILKTLLGFYGLQFRKFYNAAKSMLGKNVDNNSNTPILTKKFGKIWVLLVMEEFRRKGIADKLLQQCIDAMKKHGEKFLQVTVKTDNIPAIKVYEKKGFKTVGTCMESSGESYIMEISISPEKE